MFRLIYLKHECPVNLEVSLRGTNDGDHIKWGMPAGQRTLVIPLHRNLQNGVALLPVGRQPQICFTKNEAMVKPAA